MTKSLKLETANAKKRFMPAALLMLAIPAMLFLLFGCGRESLTVKRGDTVAVAEKGKSSPFKIVLDEFASEFIRSEAEIFRDTVKDCLGVNLEIVNTYEKQENLKYRIFFAANSYFESSSLMLDLAANEFEIKCGERNGSTYIAVAFTDGAGRCATDELIKHISGDLLSFKNGEDIKGEAKPMDSIITTNVSLRDPCVLLDNGSYYMYGTGWKVFKNDTGDLAGEWTGGSVCVTVPQDAIDNHWAPEVYKLDDLGGYYMFTTYLSEKSGKRGVAVFKSESPEGPFEMISDGHVTPKDWDSIDGTLYYDKSGQPWMIFVHEWTCNEDGIGRMSVAKMSDDLTKLISDPKDIFMGTDAPWAKERITDGPWIYTMQDGSLIMLWSNFDVNGYACGMALNKTGKPDGKWQQLSGPLFSKSISGNYDGGHGMIFKDINGKLYLSVHSPNNNSDARKTLAVFMPIKEQAGRLVADINYDVK